MNARTKVGAFVIGLTALFLSAFALGDAVEPLRPAVERSDAPATTGDEHDDMDMGGDATE